MKLKKSKLNSKAFSHIEMLIALVVIVAIGAVGFFVYKHHQDSNKPMNSVGTTASKPIIGSAVKGSSIMINGKSLGSIVPKASAMNLSHIISGAPSSPDWNIYACRTYVNAFGGVYAITSFNWKASSSPGLSTILDRTPSGKLRQQTSSSTYYHGVLNELTMNVSVLNGGDVVYFTELAPYSPTISNHFTITNLGIDLVSC